MKKTILFLLGAGLVAGGCSHSMRTSAGPSAATTTGAYNESAATGTTAAATTNGAYASGAASNPNMPSASSETNQNNNYNNAGNTAPEANAYSSERATTGTVAPAENGGPSVTTENNNASTVDISSLMSQWNLEPNTIQTDLSNGATIVRTNPRTEAGLNDDATLTSMIKRKLSSDSQVSGANIDVNCSSSEVTLSGSAQNTDQIGRAIALALDTDGVTKVSSNIRLQGSYNVGSNASNTPNANVARNSNANANVSGSSTYAANAQTGTGVPGESTQATTSTGSASGFAGNGTSANETTSTFAVNGQPNANAEMNGTAGTGASATATPSTSSSYAANTAQTGTASTGPGGPTYAANGAAGGGASTGFTGSTSSATSSAGVASANTGTQQVESLITQWRLTPQDIQSDLDRSVTIVRTRETPAGAPTGPIDDSVIVTMVKNKLESDNELASLNLDVQAHNGEVTLGGTAQSATQIGRAIALALDTDGVTKVSSNIKVGAQTK